MAWVDCILLGATESWGKFTIELPASVVDCSVSAYIKDSSTDVVIATLVAGGLCSFVANVAKTGVQIGLPPWTPALANKNAYLYVTLSLGTPPVPAVEIFMPCPVIDFPPTTAVLADDTVDGLTGGVALADVLVPRGTFNEMTRNISAGAKNIRFNIVEKIQNVDIVGEYDPPVATGFGGYYSGSVGDVRVVLRSLSVGSGSLDVLNDTQVEEAQKKVDGDINAALCTIYYTPLAKITRNGLTGYPDPVPAMARRLVAADLILNTMTGVDQNVIQTAKNVSKEETQRLYDLGSGLVGASRLSGQLLKARNRFAPAGMIASPLPQQRS